MQNFGYAKKPKKTNLSEGIEQKQNSQEKLVHTELKKTASEINEVNYKVDHASCESKNQKDE